MPRRQQQRLGVARAERAEGGDDEVLAFAQLELAAREHDEPPGRDRPGARRGMEQAGVDALQHRRGSDDAVGAEDALVPARSGDQQGEIAGERAALGRQRRVFDEGDADRRIAVEAAVERGLAHAREIVGDRRQHRRADAPGRAFEPAQRVPQRHRAVAHAPEPRLAQRIDDQLLGREGHARERREAGIVFEREGEVHAVDAPAVEAGHVPGEHQGGSPVGDSDVDPGQRVLDPVRHAWISPGGRGCSCAGRPRASARARRGRRRGAWPRSRRRRARRR